AVDIVVTGDIVVAEVVAIQDVVAGPAIDGVSAAITEDDVVARSAVDGVLASAADDYVVAAFTLDDHIFGVVDPVRAMRGQVDDVIAIGKPELLDVGEAAEATAYHAIIVED